MFQTLIKKAIELYHKQKDLTKKAVELYQQLDLMTLLENFVDELMKYHSSFDILLIFIGIISVSVALLFMGIQYFCECLNLWWPSMVTIDPFLSFKVVVFFLLTVSLYFICRKER